MRKDLHPIAKFRLCIIVMLLSGLFTIAQKTGTGKKNTLFIANEDIFGTNKVYFENIGQYGTTLSGHADMGNILYGFEGLPMPVLFTSKGVAFLQRKIKKLSGKEIERLERKGMSEEEIREKTVPIDKIITMEWLNANPHPQIIAEDAATGYHTYGILSGKASAFKKIIYKEIYPGIDVEYFFIVNSKIGFEYNLVVRPGADISLIKMKYKGDVNKIRTDSTGNLIISSAVDDIIQSLPVYYYEDDKNNKIQTAFTIANNEVGFKAIDKYNTGKTIIIDPFVTSTSALSGSFNGIAKDIDFDYNGNVYVSGGGDAGAQKMAKYNSSGSLLWTFSGTLTTPLWQFGSSEGGWVVEKTSGNIYIGQGLAGGGFRVIRLNTSGVYDNFITNANPNFAENWKMLWSCNGGTPQILVAGGGGTANNELAIITPPNVDPAPSNISGLTGGHNDISDIVIDPVTNDMYTLFSISVNTPGADSKIYKHTAPYLPTTISWTNFTGYFSVKEPFNRPYLGGSIDNSSNCIAINTEYLFFWDGQNLKAFNKSTGAVVGTAVTLSATALMQGGIFADECNNIFVGYTNGTIKVYKFDGNVFNDAVAADINIPGFSNNAVYDITYDHARNLIYACGNGFVTAIDVSQYCALPVYTVSVVSDLATLSAMASLTPAPATGSTVSFSLFDGNTLITTNTTGVFTGLTTGITYTVKAIINEACSGTQAVKDFILAAAPPVTKTGIYIPNAFSPNGDGNNDLLKAIVVGMKAFHYFSIYNRYGELVYTTTNPAFGWDGTFKGKLQNTGTFVWIVEVVDQDGNVIRQKGTTILIR